MVTKSQTLKKIREIIERHYARLSLSVLGRDMLSEEQLRDLERQGIDTSNIDSIMASVYYHNFINFPLDDISPKTKEEVEAQQKVIGLIPEGEAYSYTAQNINEKTNQLIQKLKLDVMTRIETLIRENNDDYKMDALQNLDRPLELDSLVKESSLGKLRQRLKATSKDGNRDWMKIATTEMSNAIGLGSVDRIVTNNPKADLGEIFVYRITVKDSRTCKWCRKFYEDTDGSPKLYRLSTLLDNGSNYGKKTDEWLPVTVATHVNERCSQVLELKPGFKLGTSGNPSYIGLAKWNEYITEKLQK